MISADQGFRDTEQKLLGAKGDVQAAERKLAASKEELAASKKELADVEKNWMGAKEESAKAHYSWMMDVAKRGVDMAQKAVDHYQDKLFSLDYDQRDEQIQRKFSNEGWEPRPPSANWEKKLTFFGSRDDIIGIINSYVSGVKSPAASPERVSVLSQGIHGKGFAICSTVGIMGMGKTALLRRIDQKPSLVGANKAIFINFNSGDGAIPDGILLRSTPAKILASTLLYSSANEAHNNKRFLEFCLSVDCPRRAVQLIRSNLKMKDSDMLVVAIDELCKMGEDVVEPRNHHHLRAGTLRSAMKLMDATNGSDGGSISFIFSALVEEDLREWRGNTGRSMYEGVILTRLPWERTEWTLKQLFKDNTTALKLLKNGKIIQLLQQCYGHPRSVFEVLSHTIEQLSLRGACDPTETEIYSELTPFFRNMSLPLLDFNTIARSMTQSLESEKESEKDVFLQLRKDGVLVEHEVGNWIILPLALLHWAQQKKRKKGFSGDQLALFHHVQRVFHHDAMGGLNREKHAEHVLINVEAAIRLAHVAVGPKTCFLSDLFKGAEMESNLKDRRVFVYPRNPIPSHGLVREVDSFVESKDDVLQKLSSGLIVRSKHHNEKEVEYLSPLWDATTGKMIILGAQVKHTSAGDSVMKIAEPIEPRLSFIFGEGLEFISLIYTTKTANPRNIPKCSICFNRQGLSEYTQSFGNLKLVATDKMF